MKLQPLADRLVAKQIKAAEETASGFYIPDTAKDKPLIAEVTEIGPDVKQIKVGDRVVYSDKYDGSKQNLDFVEKDLMILKEEDVLAVVTQ
jgi:chaperonin GroES